MKPIALLILWILQFYLHKRAPQNEFPPVLASVTNWNKRSLYQNSNVFNYTKKTIISQIGEDEFEKVKKYSSMEGWPLAFQHDVSKKDDSSFMKSQYEKFNKLKLYKIASFNYPLNIPNSKRYAILRIPYDENRNWDSTANWDTIYVIIEEKYILTK